MKRTCLLIGVALGIVVGSSMGRKPYEKLESIVSILRSQPEARRVKNSLFSAASDISDTAANSITQAAENVSEKLSSAIA